MKPRPALVQTRRVIELQPDHRHTCEGHTKWRELSHEQNACNYKARYYVDGKYYCGIHVKDYCFMRYLTE